MWIRRWVAVVAEKGLRVWFRSRLLLNTRGVVDSSSFGTRNWVAFSNFASFANFNLHIRLFVLSLPYFLDSNFLGYVLDIFGLFTHDIFGFIA